MEGQKQLLKLDKQKLSILVGKIDQGIVSDSHGTNKIHMWIVELEKL